MKQRDYELEVPESEWGTFVSPYFGRMKYLSLSPGGWIFRYNTTRPERDQRSADRDFWRAEKIRKDEIVQVRLFKTRAAARRCVLRWRRAIINNRMRQQGLREAGYISPGLKCPRCEQEKKLPDDYLCQKCRYGI
jgi:hypothetical protein